MTNPRYKGDVGVNTPPVSLLHRRSRLAPVAGFLIDVSGVGKGCLSGVCVIAVDQMSVDVPSPRRSKLTLMSVVKNHTSLSKGSIEYSEWFDRLTMNVGTGQFMIMAPARE